MSVKSRAFRLAHFSRLTETVVTLLMEVRRLRFAVQFPAISAGPRLGHVTPSTDGQSLEPSEVPGNELTLASFGGRAGHQDV